MDTTVENVLTALGEQAAQNYVLRKRVAELEQELGALYARIEEQNQPQTLVPREESA